MKPLPDHVLVVDDDALFRAYVRGVLEQCGYRVVDAEDGVAALAAVRASRPAAVLLDVNMPGLSGYEVCRSLREDYGPDLPVMFVSGERTESFDRVAGLTIGADDYLAKPFAADELLARLRCLLRRAKRVDPDTSTLTRRELQVLQLLAEGLDQAGIAERLVISPKTVGTHLERILAKLGAHSRAEAVALAYRRRVVSVRISA
ncbi:MAG: response regulator transcription factor [Acidobacteriota bacterium]